MELRSELSEVVKRMENFAKRYDNGDERDKTFASVLRDYAEQVDYEKKRLFNDILMLLADCMAKNDNSDFINKLDELAKEELKIKNPCASSEKEAYDRGYDAGYSDCRKLELGVGR